MGLENAREHLDQWNRGNDIIILEQSSAAVALAAAALGVTEQEIAKSISLVGSNEEVILIVAAGNQKIDNRKFKDEFGIKAKMLAFEDVETKIGHPVGGVCPFGVKTNVQVFLDRSLEDFEFVYPACGTGNSAIKLTVAELEVFSGSKKWVDVTKL